MSDIKLIIGNKNYSSWSLRAWLFLKHFKITFEEIKLPLGTGLFRQEIKKYSPTAKVPALIHGDIQVWDSLAICNYTSEFLLNGQGWPTKQTDKAIARSIVSEMHSGFPNIRNRLPMNCKAIKNIPELDTNTTIEIRRIQEIWNQCLENGSDDSWLFGDFTIADAMYAPVALRFRTYQIILKGAAERYVNQIANNVHVREWVKASQYEDEIIEASEVGENK